MPDLTAKVCGAPGCYEVVTTGYCSQHQTIRRARDRERRGQANDKRYDGRWKKYSKNFRSAHPRCAMCVQEGRTVPRLSQVTDHIVPVELGGPMFASWNHQALCSTCHDGPKHRLDNQLRRLVEHEGLTLREAVNQVHGAVISRNVDEILGVQEGRGGVSDFDEKI